MNNEIQKFDFKGALLRTLTDEAGEPWFVAKDVCDILELGTEHLRRDLDEDEVTEATNLPNWQVGSNGGRVPLIISEPGLYKLVMRSRKPEAKEFQRWVTHEVLPQIRKTGGYIPTTDADDDMTILAKAVMIGQRTMEAQKRKIAEQQTRIVELEPKARFADAVAASDGTCLVGELAKMLRQNGMDVGGGSVAHIDDLDQKARRISVSAFDHIGLPLRPTSICEVPSHSSSGKQRGQAFQTITDPIHSSSPNCSARTSQMRDDTDFRRGPGGSPNAARHHTRKGGA